ncbi:Dolichyl-phosphate beta-D-mannosyltransferase [Bertholletia excelsa]
MSEILSQNQRVKKAFGRTGFPPIQLPIWPGQIGHLSRSTLFCRRDSFPKFYISIFPPFLSSDQDMKHIVKLMTLLVAISALWIGLLQASILPRSYTWLLPLYFLVSLGCYGLLMVGVGLMRFPTCPQEAVLLQQDIAEATEYLKKKGVDVSD